MYKISKKWSFTVITITLNFCLFKNKSRCWEIGVTVSVLAQVYKNLLLKCYIINQATGC